MKARVVAALLRLSALLPLSLSRSLGRGLGRLAWWLRLPLRRVTERNIGLAFPQLSPAQQQQLAYRSLLATGELAAEMGFVWNRPWDQVRARIFEISGEAPVRDALARGQGVMMLGPHLGNWEITGLLIAELGESVALYEPHHMTALDAMIRRARQRSGTTLVPTDAKGLATLVRALRRGAITGILPDQVPPVVESGENSVFMGVPCFTMTLASKLLARSGATAFFVFAERVPDGFVVRYVPAAKGLYSADLAESLRALNEGVEACLRHCPEQYQWEYKRFRERPRGPVDYYAPDWKPGSEARKESS